MRNIKIGLRLTMSFAVLIILLVVISVISIFTMNDMSTRSTKTFTERVIPLDDLDYVNGWLPIARMNVIKAILMIDNPASLATTVKDYQFAQSETMRYLTDYKAKLDARTDASQEGKDLYQATEDALKAYFSLADKTIDAAVSGDKAAAQAQLADPTTAAAGVFASDKQSELFTFNMDAAIDADDLNTQNANNMIIIILIIAVVAVIISIALALILVNSLTKPIKKLKTALGEVAKGNLKVDASSNDRDEMGDLTRDTRRVIDVIETLINDIEKQSNEMNAGDMDAKIDETKYQGSYLVVAEGINAMVASLVGDIVEFLGAMGKFGDGEFDVTFAQRPGKKALMNNTLDNLKNNLNSVTTDIKMLINGAIDGNLSVSADADKYKNDWNRIIVGLNMLIEAFAKPMSEISASLVEMSKGNMSAKITTSYKGEYDKVKTSVNSTMDAMHSYIAEISDVLGEMSNQNFDVQITREYVGDFAAIRSALNNIIEVFNNVLSDINSSAEQVAAGAKQISESSMSLSQGSAEQASAVEELNATTTNISEQTKKNAETANIANKYASEAQGYAALGNKEMGNMLKAMDEINQSSNSISKIIKVIEDIAFQTNLLALNATVEAAHAGVHGKGFAVVAEQVRSLAGRSQEAAKDTTALIENSTEKVTHGTKIANQTADALKNIVTEINQVSDLLGTIAKSSTEQAESLNQINEGITQISQVTQTNTATSEEEAAAAEELASQAELFKNTVSKFNLKN